VAGRTVNIEMTDDKVAAIVQSLWQPLEDGTIPNVFMVLDCARDKRIEPMITRSSLSQSCLYSGQLSYGLKRSSPHIVQLDPNTLFTHDLLALGWGKSWGVFFIVPESVPISVIRHNCRKINMVKTEAQKILVFRYQDPRVLRKFLPICDFKQLQFIFGKATHIAMESNTAQQIIRYSIDTQSQKLLSSNVEIQGKMREC